GGDISGAPNSLTVGKLQGRTVSASSPTNGQVLTWNNSTGQWEPKNSAGGGGGSGGPGSYSGSFVSQTSVTFLGSAHLLGTANLVVACYDTSSPNVRVQPNSVTLNTTSYDVGVTFATPQSGRCVLSAGGSGSGGGGGGGGGGASMAAQLGDFSV